MKKYKILFFVNEELTEGRGISKKIIDQVDALKNLDFCVDLISIKYDNNGIILGRFLNDLQISTFPKLKIFNRIYHRFYFLDLLDIALKDSYNCIYIRYTHYSNPLFILFLRKLNQSRIKVVLEIPTYPYDSEYKKNNIFRFIEKSTRKYFKYFVDVILTFSNHEEIFGVRTLNISNALNVNRIPFVNSNGVDVKGNINLICVSSMEFWHGYDRLIEGLNIYKNQKLKRKYNIYFHIVGNYNKTEGLKYKKLVEKYSLEDAVIFHGSKVGKELDDIFEFCDIGIGCLACHRKNIYSVQSLKNREYCARGIPFLYSENDPDFDFKNFVLKVKPNDSPINVSELIRFYEESKELKVLIRKFAEENISWEIQFLKLKNFLI